jgi:hypothetical protein
MTLLEQITAVGLFALICTSCVIIAQIWHIIQQDREIQRKKRKIAQDRLHDWS